MSTNEPRVLSLRDYVSIFRSRAWWMAAVLFLALSVAIALSALTKPLFRAEAHVHVEPSAGSLTGDGSSVSSNTRDRNLQNEVDFAESDRVALQAQVEFGAEIEADVSRGGSSDKLIFTAVDGDADRAAAIANTWAEAFVSERGIASVERYLSSLHVIDTRLDEIATDRLVLEGERAATTDTTAIDSQLAALDSTEMGLREQIDEIDLLIELNQTGTVSILNAATAPESPFAPNLPLNIALGLVGGALLAAGVGLGMEALDNTIRQPDELRAAMDYAPVLATVPAHDEFGEDSGPSQAFTEAIRALQLGIEFSKTQRTRCRSVLITSANEDAGTSMIVSNLAVSYAESGSKVLLIDADMHNASQASYFGVPDGPGLAEHLEGNGPLEITIEMLTGTSRIGILPAGKPTVGPSQLLGSEHSLGFIHELSEKYDIVLIDSPPLLPMADTRTLAQVADATIITAMANETTTDQIEDVMAQLEQVRVSPLGGVLNGLERRNGD